MTNDEILDVEAVGDNLNIHNASDYARKHGINPNSDAKLNYAHLVVNGEVIYGNVKLMDW